MGSSSSRKKGVLINDSTINRIPLSISAVFKSSCKIVYDDKIGSGFLIKLLKGNNDFFCLMTNGHVISEEIIKQRKIINIYYDSQSKTKEIDLFPDERYIKFFKDINIDATVIEILPKDDISKDYFLIPPKDYMYEFKTLLNKEIIILHYVSGELCYSYGKINEINENEFTHFVSTESGSSGSPVFLKESLKVIGIHKSGDKNKKENYGDFIGPIFKYLKNFPKDEYNKKIKESINKISKNKIIKKNDNIEEKINIEYSSNNFSDKILNKMTIRYKNNNNIFYFQININYGNRNKIKIFGDKFVNNNKDNCYLLINGQQFELCEYLELNENQKKDNTLEIKLIETKPISNMSYLFHRCILLISLPDISEWNTTNVTDMNNMFYNCRSLESLPDISKWNTTNIKDMSYLFCWCNSLVSLPDISKWDTKNVIYLNSIFGCCTSLKSLPDISKWNTKNVIKMSRVFGCCISLKSLPDISGWDTKNVKCMHELFDECRLLKYLPDIDKWNTQKVSDMIGMFNKCTSLISIPDISKWETKNVTNMSEMFDNCNSLISLPDISKWNTKNVDNFDNMLNNCNSLIYRPEYFSMGK